MILDKVKDPNTKHNKNHPAEGQKESNEASTKDTENHKLESDEESKERVEELQKELLDDIVDNIESELEEEMPDWMLAGVPKGHLFVRVKGTDGNTFFAHYAPIYMEEE